MRIKGLGAVGCRISAFLRETLKLIQLPILLGIMQSLLIFVILSFKSFPVASESFDSAIFDVSELEFAKDITTLIIESTLKSKCDGNVFVVSPYCEKYLDHALASIVRWAPPLLIVKFREYNSIPSSEKDSWTKYLAWNRKSCSLIFICDLIPPPPLIGSSNGSTDYDATEFVVETEDQKGFDGGYTKFPRFVTSLDQILYFSESQNYNDPVFDGLIVPGMQSPLEFPCINDRTSGIELELMKKTGLTLQVRVQYSLNNTRQSRMQVCSQCEFCIPHHGHYANLGDWQRNKTHFGKFLDVFDSYKNKPFNNFHFRVGYFDYYPHFACPQPRQNILGSATTTSTVFKNKCLGIEWEIITQLSKTLKFSFNLTNVGNELENPKDEVSTTEVQMTNFTRMIASLQSNAIDFAVGGITVTSERAKSVDFSQIFQTEPIVFVVQKPKNIFVLGIWLAFQPQVWLIVLLLIAIISFLFQSITNDSQPPCTSCCFKRKKLKRFSLSILIDEAIKASKRKPLIVRMFDALELTLQPMLAQPLNSSQICQPRRFKMLLILWWFSCLIITTLYSTSLISSLINPVITKEPESLTELIDAGYYFKFGGRHAAVQELINTSSTISSLEHPLQDPAEFRASLTNHPYYSNTEIDKVTKLLQIIRDRLLLPNEVVNPNQVAYIVEESGIGNENSLKLTNMIVMKERLFITGYSLALKPNSHWKRKLDTSLGRLSAGGLISHWSSKLINKGKGVLERKFRLRERLGQINLNLKILSGAFTFLLLGLAFSSLIFGLEHWNKRYVFRMYSWAQILSLMRAGFRHLSRFYQDQNASDSQSKRRKRNQEKFRRVVDTVVRLRHEQNNLPFLR